MRRNRSRGTILRRADQLSPDRAAAARLARLTARSLEAAARLDGEVAICGGLTVIAGGWGAIHNLALPTGESADWPADVAAMRAAFNRLGAAPCVEIVGEGPIGLERALLDAGFAPTSARPALARLPGARPAAALEPLAVDWPNAASSEAELEAFAAFERRCFELAGAPGDRQLAALRRELRAGVTRLARLRDGERTIAIGSLLGCAQVEADPPFRLAELAGLAVAPDRRGAGLGSRLAERISGAWFEEESGDALWLVAQNDAAGRFYRRSGWFDLGPARSWRPIARPR